MSRRWKHGSASRRCGRTPEYQAWNNMIQRCTNPNHPRYADWGGRGITVCDCWQGENGFTNFLADVGEKPEPKSLYSIERQKNDEGYSPENCFWATRDRQMNNQRPLKHRRQGAQSSFKGVTWNKRMQRWQASIRTEKRKKDSSRHFWFRNRSRRSI